MGQVGWGRAFNLRFMPRTAPRMHVDSFWHRPYLPRGGSLFINETTNVQIGPSGFWGFLTGAAQGFFGGGMFGMNNMWNMQTSAYTNPLAMLNAGAYPQGTTQAQTGEDKSLKNLIQVYGSDYEIVSHPKKEGFYQAHSKKGGELIEGDYDTVMKKLAEIKEEAKVEKAPKVEKVPKNTEVPDTKVKPDELKNGVTIEVLDEVWDAANPNGDGHITGETKFSGNKNDEGFYELITIGGKHYKLQKEKVNGDPVYKSLDGKENDTYRLSKKDGKIVLIQSESDKGQLSGPGRADFY